MLRTLVNTAGRLLNDLQRVWRRDRRQTSELPPASWTAPGSYRPLHKVTLTDEVGRTLFEEFAAHRRGDRGEEETGWLLLGLRQESEAVVLATLPAGAHRDAGVAHVQFSSAAQVLGSRIVRQKDKRLIPVGVVHTHPGSLRHPSDGDYRGDSHWVSQLRGHEGVFGIGTADGRGKDGSLFAVQPKPNVQCLGELTLSWYSLRKGDRQYRPLPYGLTIGPDMARPLHGLWPSLEEFADQLNRLYRQQAGLAFAVVEEEGRAALAVQIPLAEPGDAIRVLLNGDSVRYYLLRAGDVLEADFREPRIDRGVYLLLAELSAQYGTDFAS